MARRYFLLIILSLLPALLFADGLYWARPLPVASPAKFIQTASSANLGAAVWQEFVPSTAGTAEGQYYFSLRLTVDGVTWRESKRFLGPFPYKGKLYRNFTIAVDAGGRILIAAAVEERAVAVFASSDQAATWSELARLTADQPVVVPLIEVSSRNELLLFVSFLLKEEEGLYFSRSSNGSDWSRLTSFIEPDEKLFQTQLPAHAVYRRRDCVVFQARLSRTVEYQLFIKSSGDGGNSWTRALPITSSLAAIDGIEADAQRISNQRPFLLSYTTDLLLTWERNLPPNKPQVYAMTINENGRIKDARGALKPETRVSTGSANIVYNPQLVLHQGKPYHLWFENTADGPDRVFFCPYAEAAQDRVAVDLSQRVPGNSIFPQAVEVKGFLSLFWENQESAAAPIQARLFFLGPDLTAEPPVLTALNFPADGFGRLTRLKFRWEIPADTSGIKEIYAVVGRGKNVALKDAELVIGGERERSVDLTGEGTWYISLFSKDAAGNVSAPARISYTRDTTPPGRVRFTAPVPESDGFLPSNTFQAAWEMPAGDEIGGYAFSLKQITPDFRTVSASALSYPEPEDTPSLKTPAMDFSNLENGVWALSVSAFDKAQNKGDPETIVFRLNKYKLVTSITSVNPEPDDAGVYSLSILGRGFTGVDQVIIDRDGKPPYDYEFTSQRGPFSVVNDRFITGLSLADVKEGEYQVGLHHAERGYYFSGKGILKVDKTGPVKYLPFGSTQLSPITQFSKYFLTLSFTDIMLWLIVLILAVVLFFGARKVVVLGREAVSLRLEVNTFIEGGDLPMPEKKKKIALLRRKGLGLRLKFTFLISLLTLLVVLIVALPISFIMVRIQQQTMAQGLYDEVKIILNEIESGTKQYLFEKNNLLIDEQLERSFSQLPPAEYAIVTGPRFYNPQTGETDLGENARLDTASLEHIWSQNDPAIASKVKGGVYTPIDSVITDDITPRVEGMARAIDTRAREMAGALVKELEPMLKEYDGIYLSTRKKDLDRKAVLEPAIEMNRKMIKAELAKIGESGEVGEIKSLPAFDAENLERSYIFYKPIVHYQTGYDHYYWGLVRLQVSTKAINAQISASRQILLGWTSAIALVAIGLGLAGALILASIIITPLRRLTRGVAVIRDTTDKSLLKDHQITVRTRDELRDLADAVNQMTQGLVKAAIANKELIIGQEIQKMFIPLETGPNGKKRTTGAADNESVDIFGYYEGAKVVSGDYFDFKQLDDRHFAIIKCDVAGKGVAGSLIMIEVATLFLAYFKDWSLKRNGLKIEDLVYRINDMLEERGFKGRFAQLSLCLLDSATGACHICHAGDKALHIYRNRTMAHEVLTLSNTPAAGVFHSTMIPVTSAFRVEPQKLEKGDTLFLFTDGLEEAKRTFRDGEFKPMVCTEPGLKDGESHGGTHVRGGDTEEMGIARFEAVTAAVFAHGSYQLVKFHNPLANEELLFDFSACQGTAEEAVLALAAVEKVFRISPDPAATHEDVVRVDKKIDAFLGRTFSLYRQYFKDRSEREAEPDYVFYPGLKEDEQYDDLTILAIRKK